MIGLKVNKFATYFLHYIIENKHENQAGVAEPTIFKISSRIDGGLGEGYIVHRPKREDPH